MIIRIKLASSENVILPKSYNHILQAFFYRNMDPVISKFLHDIGFVYGKRRFKLFTFSKVIAKQIAKNRKKGFVVFEPPLTLYFASPFMYLVSLTANGFLRKNTFKLGKNTLFLESIESVKPNVKTKTLTVRCLSPITVYKTPPGEKRFHYLNPWQEEFYELLVNNLKKKYNLVYGKPYTGKLKINPLKLSEKYKKKVVYKGTLIEAWEGYFLIEGEEDILKLALEVGLGNKNSAGFGMVEHVSDSDLK